MTELAPSMTRGEALTLRLLEKFPRHEYFFAYEPRLIVPSPNAPGGMTHTKPDFVIVGARFGVVVLEIKDWTRIVGGTQTQIDTIRKDGARVTYENPYNVAERYAYDLNRVFETRVELWETYRGKRALKFPWQVMVGLPHIPQALIAAFESNGVWTPNTVAGREAFAHPAALQAFIEHLPYKYRLDKPLSLDLLDIIREVLDPTLAVYDDGRVIGTLTRDQDRLIREGLTRLAPKQLPLLNDDDLSSETVGLVENHEVRLVRGVAGSGKTLVLIRRAQYLASQYPDAQILVVMFNKQLTGDLARRLQAAGKHVTVVTFHKLCSQIMGEDWQSPENSDDWLEEHAALELKALNLPTAFVVSELEWRLENGLTTDEAYLNADRDGRGYRLDAKRRALINAIYTRYHAHKTLRDPAARDWADVPFAALAALSPAHPLWQYYDAVLIDEGQDFAPSWMRVIKALLKPDGGLLICDDPTQSIFRNYTWRAKGVPVLGRTSHLRVPFRSTRRISEAAHALIEADAILSAGDERTEPNFTSYELPDGYAPILAACSDADAEHAYILATIETLIDDGIAPEQIAILCHHKGIMATWKETRARGVNVTTFRQMKGLEFPIVFVPHVNRAFDPDGDAEATAAARRRMFTAMTRARSRLYLSYSGDLPDALSPLLDYVTRVTPDAAPPPMQGESHS
jgi:hypothetical protein